MDADWSVELGSEDPVLDFPWTDESGSLAYVDLKHDPERVQQIAETRDYPELAAFLLKVNGAESPWITAKCDVWFEEMLSPAEEVYGGRLKLCSYVDLLFVDESARSSFQRHEDVVKTLSRMLSEEDDTAAVAEFIVRRCWFRADTPAEASGQRGADSAAAEVQEGFCITFYLSGYGEDKAEARSHWAAGIEVAKSVLARVPADLR
jgi:hypothetical protein